MIKKLKTILFCLSMLVIGFIIGCSGSSSYAEQKRPIKIWFQNENGKMETYNVIDEETGVQYIVVSGELYSESVGVAITPRLNSDGSLYVGK